MHASPELWTTLCLSGPRLDETACLSGPKLDGSVCLSGRRLGGFSACLGSGSMGHTACQGPVSMGLSACLGPGSMGLPACLGPSSMGVSACLGPAGRLPRNARQERFSGTLPRKVAHEIHAILRMRVSMKCVDPAGVGLDEIVGPWGGLDKTFGLARGGLDKTFGITRGALDKTFGLTRGALDKTFGPTRRRTITLFYSSEGGRSIKRLACCCSVLLCFAYMTSPGGGAIKLFATPGGP